MDKQTTQIIIIVAVIALAYVAYNSCSITCKKVPSGESYRSIPFGGIHSIDRNINSHMFDENNSFSTMRIKNDPGNTDRHVHNIPFDAHRAVFSQPPTPLRRNQVDFCVEDMDCAQKKSNGKVVLFNDNKLRRDMIESGDMELYRQTVNTPTPHHKPYFTNRRYENELIRPDHSLPPLYSNDYHEDAILGQ